ncbi:lanthionine synthetase C family protein [Actinomadura rubrisoli]|uniref:Lanthionine synthetase C family protein n=1 Tax=Actinomadura rubrisoli TaxID=2530368 RepID=A0A4R5B1Y2_9ACTN|nr:lanthionine synthetase C family protein [Actinomadura rubrisoli]TDD79661.1 hypothetical protein E1298_27295 [Actinomadura rubrisoli]
MRPTATPPAIDPAPGWSQSLANGAPGITLLHIERTRASTGDQTTVRRWVTAMTRNPITAHPQVSGLFRGAPAVAFALHTADDAAYTHALMALDQHITTLIQHRLQQAHQRIDDGRLPVSREFDLISGLTGLGAYLLHRHNGGDLLRDVLNYLIRLTKPLKFGDETVPGWWCRHGPNSRPSPHWPDGHGNLGMAHGIAGPLALLSVAMRRGITVTGHAESIRQICAFLDHCCRHSRFGTWWPGVISFTEWRLRTVRQPGPQRPSWCYGTPGLVRAQQLAGIALADTHRQHLAEHALSCCVTDEHHLSQLRDSSLCHGWAGLVHATWRVAADARDTDSGKILAEHHRHLLTRMHHHSNRHGLPPGNGLLEGTAGPKLAQITADSRLPPRWDACLLLNG